MGQSLKEYGGAIKSLLNITMLNNALLKYNITSKEQISHFLAQCFHEGGLGLTERNWSKDNWADDEYQIDKEYFNEKYSNRVDLGKAGGDDGYLYQGADYVTENYAWETAAYFWTQENINEIIDEGGDSKDVSYKVSREVNRYDKDSFDRRYEYYKKVSDILN